jgi:hypothetical protein
MDPKWWLRAGLAVVLIAFVLLIARATMMAFSPGQKHVDRFEARVLGTNPPAPGGGPATTPTPRGP